MEHKENDSQKFGGRGKPRIWSGILLLTAGVLLLAYKMGAPLPGWLFTWPVLIIAIGLLTGFKSKFHNPGAFIMILIGCIFLADQSNPQLNFKNYILPSILIGVGIIYILRPKHHWADKRKRRWAGNEYENIPTSSYAQSGFVKNDDNAEYVNINAVFGGVKKIILSKNFKGGEINSFMGGTELNLLQADLQHPVVLEINNVFGGTKLIFPSNWDVKNEVTAVFGGIEDKRSLNTTIPDSEKTVIIKGACVFGGIEITNY